MEPADIKRVRGVSAAPAPGDALAAALRVKSLEARLARIQSLLSAIPGDEGLSPDGVDRLCGLVHGREYSDEITPLAAEVTALRGVCADLSDALSEFEAGMTGTEEDIRVWCGQVGPVVGRFEAALSTPSAAGDALVERVRAEALEEAAEALPRILKIFGAGCSVAGPARVGGSGHDDPNPAGCPDCVAAAAAAIRALKGGPHG